MNWYVAGASLLGTGVEFTEALTIVLAVLLTKGWRTAFSGALAAVAALAALVAIFGFALIHAIQLPFVQFIVGLIMLLFGMRWLRKAVLRYSGYKALHDEGKAFQQELTRQQASSADKGVAIDSFGAVTAFNGVLLEGLESIFIVITVGLAAHALGSAILGSIVALALIVAAGVALRKPLQAVPENTLKFLVGVMMSAFGTFWTGEALGVAWWNQDVSIPVVALFYLVASVIVSSFVKAGRLRAKGGSGVKNLQS